MDVKNIEQYVAKIIITELNKQNEELKKLRILASKIIHCSVCYTPKEYSTHHECFTCGKVACNDSKCYEGWFMEFPKKGYRANYCSKECCDKDEEYCYDEDKNDLS